MNVNKPVTPKRTTNPPPKPPPPPELRVEWNGRFFGESEFEHYKTTRGYRLVILGHKLFFVGIILAMLSLFGVALMLNPTFNP